MMHQQFNIQQLYALPPLYVFCIYLRTNSDLCRLQHKLMGFYNRDEKCLQRGTDWVFKYSGLRLVFKWLNINEKFSNWNEAATRRKTKRQRVTDKQTDR